MPELAYVNGRINLIEDAVVSINDRGLLFADSVYEALRIYGGKPFKLEGHLRRLANSLEGIRLGYAYEPERLTRSIYTVIQESGIEEAFLYIQITRGAAPRELRFPEHTPPNVIITIRHFHQYPAWYRESGISAILVDDERWTRNDVKTTIRLPNVLARQLAVEAGAQEALFVESDGHVSEGTATNLFTVSDGKLQTTPLGKDILPGITREVILELASSEGIPVVESCLPATELIRQDEAFLSATTFEVMPLTKVDGKPVGNGTPGPVTEKLYNAFQKMVQEFREQSVTA